MFQPEPGTRTSAQDSGGDFELAACVRLKDGGLNHGFHLQATTGLKISGSVTLCHNPQTVRKRESVAGPTPGPRRTPPGSALPAA